MTRIRYTKIPKSRTLKSTPILINNETYIVKVTGSYYCIESSSQIVFSAYCGSQRACKAHAKKILSKMGAVFQEEIRRRL